MRGWVTEAFEDIVQTVNDGGVIAYPTEAVFGLGCDPYNLTAVQRLLAIKQRPADKGLILIAADINQLQDFILPLSYTIERRIMPTWPGPVTWLLPVKPEVSPLVRGNHDSIAVRITAHMGCQRLCQKLGKPLISTSANLAGEEPARSVLQAQQSLGQQVDAIFDFPLGKQSQPSQIRDAKTGTLIRA